MSAIERRLVGIEHAFFVDEDGAGLALEFFQRAREEGKGRYDLGRLLRHHEERVISDRDTWDRDHFDTLLAYCGMVEVACLAGYLPGGALPDSHVARVGHVLRHPDVRRYYEEHYPLLLPQLHLMRLEDKLHVMPAGRAAEAAPMLFDEFFALSQPIETGEAMETFLWFLDGGSRGDKDIEDTLRALRSPKSFLKCIAAGPGPEDDGELDPLSASVQGFVAFLEFAPRLLALLQRAQGMPLLQSAMWHYHGYWLGQMHLHMGAGVRRAVHAIDAWGESSKPALHVESGEDQDFGRTTRAHQERALAYLSSGRFRYPLVELLLDEAPGLARQAQAAHPLPSRSFDLDVDEDPAVERTVDEAEAKRKEEEDEGEGEGLARVDS